MTGLHIRVPAHKGGGVPWDLGHGTAAAPDIYACIEPEGQAPACFGPCPDSYACVLELPTSMVLPAEGTVRFRVMDADIAEHDRIFSADRRAADLADPAARRIDRRDPADGRRFSLHIQTVESPPPAPPAGTLDGAGR
ncbi:MAG: hypothetical protein AAF677_18620 [Pseudomonadota bacterium]